MPKTILFLSANPKNMPALRLDEAVRDIREGIKQGRESGRFVIERREAVRPSDLQQIIRDVNPWIVHFSGHGKGEAGLVFEDKSGRVQCIQSAALAGLFKLFSHSIECVVLNACYSEEQAEAIAAHINHTIGMSQEIGNRAAIAFSTSFYSAIAAGKSIEIAYEFGLNSIQLEGSTEHLTPVLKKKAGLDEAMVRYNSARKNSQEPEELGVNRDDINGLLTSEGIEKRGVITTVAFLEDGVETAIDCNDRGVDLRG